MSKVCQVVINLALLTAYFQASYFHIHPDQSSDHVKTSHLAQGLTVHTHLFVPTHRGGRFPAVEPFAIHEEDDAIFLAWAPEPTQFGFELACVPCEPKTLSPPDQATSIVLPTVRHSHDPPLVVSSAPRSPPA